MFGDSVEDLLREYGSLMTLVRLSTQPVYDPATGEMTNPESDDYDLRAVFVNYSDRNVDGSVIQAGDRQLLVSAAGSTTEPQIGDSVGGLRVVNVRTFAPNGTNVAYACQMRK